MHYKCYNFIASNKNWKYDYVLKNSSLKSIFHTNCAFGISIIVNVNNTFFILNYEYKIFAVIFKKKKFISKILKLAINLKYH